MRVLLPGLVRLRRHPRRGVRALWWAGVVLLVWMLLSPGGLLAAIPWVWTAANYLAAAWAGTWGVGRARVVLSARGVVLRWALWMSSAAVLAAVVGVTPRIPAIAQAAESARFGFVSFFAVPVLFVVALFLAVPLGFLGAALGAACGAPGAPLEAGAARGARAVWCALLLVVAAAVALHGSGVRGSYVAAAACSVPSMTVALCRTGWRVLPLVQRTAGPLLNALARCLVWRRATRSGVRVVDIRGAVVGLLVSAVVLGASAADGLLSLQANGLAALIQLRNILVFGTGAGMGDRHQALRKARERVVLLTMDEHARHLALVERSESALQAAMIRRLGEWGAACVVLPLPRLGVPPKEGLPLLLGGQEVTPEPSAAAVARSLRDLPLLTSAVARAGNVVVAVDDARGSTPQPAVSRVGLKGHAGLATAAGPDPTEALISLLRAARGCGSAAFEAYGSSQLPAVSTRRRPAWRAAPLPRSLYAAPLLVVALTRERPLALTGVPGRPGRVAVSGVEVPEVASGRVLVDFQGPPARVLRRISYGSLLRGERVYAPPSAQGRPGQPTGQWVPPAAALKGKIVFLDSLTAGIRDTPVGPVSTPELTASATVMLLSNWHITRGGAWIWWMLLLAGALVGHACARRDPLDASWRASGAIFLATAVSVWAFVGAGVWVDPVAPGLAFLATLLLVTQVTFAQERRDRERNRALLQRFVAPQVVEELLDDPQAALGLGGRRQRVCVLFADVRGFTQFAESRTPEEVIEVISTYLTALTEALHAHGGLLDKYTGDGLMALFRIGEAEERDVVRAVQAAVAMRDSAAMVSERLAAQGLQPLDIGLGMHYGEAVVGLVGSPAQVNYTAVGHAVVVSQRLQGIAAGGQVVVSDSVCAASGEAVEVEPWAPVRVKGLSDPVRPYRVLGVREGSALSRPGMR